MPRRIREFTLQSTAGAGPGTAADQYLDKVVKYVPADVVAAWTAAVAVINGTVGIPTIWVLLICLIVGLGITYWWTLRQTAEKDQPPATKQALIATVAFLVWVLALGDLNDVLTGIKLGESSLWNAAYAKLILIGFTLVSGRL
jgi:FtsH-binding integral membrane protein